MMQKSDKNSSISPVTPKPFRLMVDSGAFSVWTRGDQIEREDYLEYLQKREGRYEVAINLDVIPGRPSSLPSASEVASAAEASIANYKFFRREGVKVIPVFHYNEPIKYLHKIIESGADYIALGGAAKLIGKKRIEWLDKVFCHIDASKIKVHGLALTSLDVIQRFPFYSADSTSPIMQGAMGDISLLVNPRESRQIHMTRLDEQPENIKKLLASEAAQIGMKFEDLKSNLPRCAFNVYQFTKAMSFARPAYKRASLFSMTDMSRKVRSDRSPCILYMGVNGLSGLRLMSRFHNCYLISFARCDSFGMKKMKKIYERAQAGAVCNDCGKWHNEEGCE